MQAVGDGQASTCRCDRLLNVHVCVCQYTNMDIAYMYMLCENIEWRYKVKLWNFHIDSCNFWKLFIINIPVQTYDVIYTCTNIWCDIYLYKHMMWYIPVQTYDVIYTCTNIWCDIYLYKHMMCLYKHMMWCDVKKLHIWIILPNNLLYIY